MKNKRSSGLTDDGVRSLKLIHTHYPALAQYYVPKMGTVHLPRNEAISAVGYTLKNLLDVKGVIGEERWYGGLCHENGRDEIIVISSPEMEIHRGFKVATYFRKYGLLPYLCGDGCLRIKESDLASLSDKVRSLLLEPYFVDGEDNKPYEFYYVWEDGHLVIMALDAFQ